jgi:hypothetical protein
MRRRSQACAVSSSYCRCHHSASAMGSGWPGHWSTRRSIRSASRVARVRQAHPAVPEQLGRAGVRQREAVRGRRDQPVDEPDALGVLRRQRLPDEPDVQPGPRRGPRDDLGQGLPHDHDRVVGHDQGELAFRGGRLEIRGGREQPFRGIADRAHLFGQLRAERGQRVLAPVPGQQLVAEVPAEPGQRGARRGLGHAEPFGGARHAALAQQLAQRHEQVQVEIGQVSERTRHGGTI